MAYGRVTVNDVPLGATNRLLGSATKCLAALHAFEAGAQEITLLLRG